MFANVFDRADAYRRVCERDAEPLGGPCVQDFSVGALHVAQADGYDGAWY